MGSIGGEAAIRDIRAIATLGAGGGGGGTGMRGLLELCKKTAVACRYLMLGNSFKLCSAVIQ